MSTQCTASLRSQFDEFGESVDPFIQAFSAWKASDEYGSYLFGKDGEYASAVLKISSGKLKHVHLVPVVDTDALVAWERDHERRSRKTSDRALVYAEDTQGNFLLLFILDEPEAHEIARMATEEHRTLMRQLAAVAEEWAFSGEILA
ncbi:MAG: type II toxin-antitoxin system YafO family toxin [Hydrogenophaga sp.]|uniref:type II toxin-antitoxin system YafO family toxin n=1 Tax=Hydrogenophaga sp. TaxID=1904254 RepID=UPI00403742AE